MLTLPEGQDVLPRLNHSITHIVSPQSKTRKSEYQNVVSPFFKFFRRDKKLISSKRIQVCTDRYTLLSAVLKRGCHGILYLGFYQTYRRGIQFY